MMIETKAIILFLIFFSSKAYMLKKYISREIIHYIYHDVYEKERSREDNAITSIWKKAEDAVE